MINQRRKGHDFERFIANQLKPFFPNARRGLDQAAIGRKGCDVEGTPYWIECKNTASFDLAAAFQQAARDKKVSGDTRSTRVIAKAKGDSFWVFREAFVSAPSIEVNMTAPNFLRKVISDKPVLAIHKSISAAAWFVDMVNGDFLEAREPRDVTFIFGGKR